MDGAISERVRGFRLYEPGHTLGLSCDELGPSLGPIRLLEKGEMGFRPRPLDDLEAVVRAVFGRPVSCASLVPGLRAVARALDEGDMCRAIIATQHLQLPSLSEAAASRALAAERLLKASPDDDKHPSYPKGAPDGVGGEYEPKEGGDGGSDNLRAPAKSSKTANSNRILRQAIKAGLGRILSARRLARLVLEGGSNVVPGLDILGDAAMVEDLSKLAGDIEDLISQTRVAQSFVETGPRNLDSLLVSTKDLRFTSYDDFKKTDLTKYFGSAGGGYEYHHIVEQGPQNSDIPQEFLQSTKNIVRIPKLIHERITSQYMVAPVRGQGSLLAQLSKKSFDDQYSVGLNMLRREDLLK